MQSQKLFPFDKNDRETCIIANHLKILDLGIEHINVPWMLSHFKILLM